MDIETIEIRQARQRASVKWLLSKAFNNRVPDNLKQPFYRDHENQEHLKPQIVVGLGNATLYCQTLSNLYSDPNYQSLNHWSIIQTLARKGVPVAESAEMPLTETVLIQTNPLRINAHMSVIESLMILYAKEISSGDRISNAIRRISGSSLPTTGQNYEQFLLSWISHACAALKKRIEQEIENGATDENGVRLQTPDIPIVRSFQDLCDGVCLALLISYYCPKVVPWNNVRINYLPAVEDSIHNVLLVSNFSQKHLPYSVFHMTPEDITYMRGSMKQNLVVLLADLFNLFEIHPAKCVCYPGMESPDVDRPNSGANEHGIFHRRGLTCQPVTPIPDLRSDRVVPSTSPTNRPPFQVTRSASATVITHHRPTLPKENHSVEHSSSNYEYATTGSTDEGFVVHKSRGITTLSTMHSQEPLVPARLRQAKEKSNTETKADERGDSVPAGRPSNWEQSRRPSFAGRRSRRNSSSEDSQLTIENFGGSQDQLNMIGRGFERERDRERERKFSNTSVEQAVVTRSSLADARGTLQIGYDTDSGSEKQDRETEKTSMRRQGSMDNVSLRNIIHSKEKDFPDGEMIAHHIVSNSSAYMPEEDLTPKRKTSISSLPSNTNTTTWQQQSALLSQNDNTDLDPYSEENSRPLVDATKLSTILMKLEEKRHHMEQEKRKIELAHSKHQEKVAKAAFLQAINKGKQHNQNDGECKQQPVVEEKCNSNVNADGNKPDRPSTVITQDELESSLESKWDTLSNNSKSTPDMDPNEFDRYQQSIALMNSNLQDIQQDIHRLATKQNQIHAQHMQAQQLLQAQQIANMLNQNQPQPYGSQQHIPGQYQRQAQQSFGSTPHLQQSFNSPNSYNSRPPSRDPYQQQQHTMQPQQIQYINEHGQYISPSSLPPQPLVQQQPAYVSHMNSNHQQSPRQIYSRENSQIYINENGYNNPYVSNHIHAQQSQQSHLYSTDPNHQYQSHQYVNRPPEYDDYPPPHRGRDPNSPQSNQFYLHESKPQQPQQIQQPTQRRTWAQSAAAQNIIEHPNYNQHQQLSQPQQQHIQQQNQLVDVNAWQSQNMSPKMVDTRTWRSSPQPNNVQRESGGGLKSNNNSGVGGFMLHQNGGNGDLNHLEKSYQNLFPVHSSPQHRQTPPARQISNNHRDNNRQLPTSALMPSDDMAPQSISFIGDDEEIDQIEMNIEIIPHDKSENMRNQQMYNDHNRSGQIQQQHYDNDISLGKLNITSGSLTYRIPSPSRPALNAHSFQDPQEEANEKGFYISFDDEQPKRPKPPLRAKRSPKKEKSLDLGMDKREQQISQMQNQISQNDKQETNRNNNSSVENSKATYNKYNDSPMQLRQINDNQSVNMNNGTGNNMNDRRHLEDVTNQQMQQQQQQQYQHQQHQQLQQQHQQQQYPYNQQQQTQHTHSSSRQCEPKENKALIIGNELINLDPDSVDEMERKKEKIMLLSLQRREQQEEAKRRKEIEANQRRAQEQLKEEERARKKEEQAARRAAILEQHKLKKAIEEAEREGKTIDRSDLMMKHHMPQQSATPRLRQQKMTRPRPKTIHVESGSVDISEASSLSSRGKKGSSTNLTGGYGSHLSSNSMRRDFYRGSQDSLTVKESPDEYPSTSSTPIGRRGSYKNSRDTTSERGRTLSRISVAKGSSLNFRGRKSNSLMNLCDTDSGLGRATPPRRAPSPGMGPSGRHMPSPSGPGSLPPGLVSKRRMFDDGSSDISSTPNSMMEYSGPKLYKQPAAKSNRGIILNAVEYCVFPGVVNRDAKQKVLDKIARSEAKHFLVLFRDAGCQFRALYSYNPENESIIKLYGTGPSQVDEVMFDKFFKYNSGGKCFSQVHTKHLTVTIDAFTIHNSLWQGKKVHLPSKKDMALVI